MKTHSKRRCVYFSSSLMMKIRRSAIWHIYILHILVMLPRSCTMPGTRVCNSDGIEGLDTIHYFFASSTFDGNRWYCMMKTCHIFARLMPVCLGFRPCSRTFDVAFGSGCIYFFPSSTFDGNRWYRMMKTCHIFARLTPVCLGFRPCSRIFYVEFGSGCIYAVQRY